MHLNNFHKYSVSDEYKDPQKTCAREKVTKINEIRNRLKINGYRFINSEI